MSMTGLRRWFIFDFLFWQLKTGSPHFGGYHPPFCLVSGSRSHWMYHPKASQDARRCFFLHIDYLAIWWWLVIAGLEISTLKWTAGGKISSVWIHLCIWYVQIWVWLQLSYAVQLQRDLGHFWWLFRMYSMYIFFFWSSPAWLPHTSDPRQTAAPNIGVILHHPIPNGPYPTIDLKLGMLNDCYDC